MTQIPCSIGILTLNCADSLPACLASVKDFAEIIVCDGNSTDGTQQIAQDFGAKVIKQYDTTESNIACVMDKAAVRQKNMTAATHDWYFFMDADDTLSAEAVEEIRGIVDSPQMEFLAYRMPTRIFLNDREIKHEATYPSYQLRLVHRNAKGYFKGLVHDRLVFDQAIKIGNLKSFYNFYWSKERQENLRAYFNRYVNWELQVMEFRSLGQFIYSNLYRRPGIILKYLFYRLPKMYLRYGFRDSMPLSVELEIVNYHFKIFIRSFGKYLTTRFWFIFLKETFRGKDLYRILTNFSLSREECFGSILDIGGGQTRASYFRFLKMTKWFKLTTVDIDPLRQPDVVADLMIKPWPLKDNYFDHILAMNLFEHLTDRDLAVAECWRLLKIGGRVLGVVPFLVNYHPDPTDYVRMTNEEIESLFKRAGFKSVVVRPVGVGPFSAGYALSDFVWPKIFKPVIFLLVYLLDKIVGWLKPSVNFSARFPLAYIFIATK